MCVAADQSRPAPIRPSGRMARSDGEPGDDVVIREDQTVGAQDDAGAAAAVGLDARDRRRHGVDSPVTARE